MRFAVEAWEPEYGSSSDDSVLTPGDTPVDVSVEVAETEWSPRTPAAGVAPAASTLFVDGVLRVDARIWVEEGPSVDRPGLCGSYAAGAVRCAATAEIVAAEVRRGLFTAAPDATPVETRSGIFHPRATAAEGFDQLHVGLQQRMRELEIDLAHAAAGEADLIVVDGPLTDRQTIPGAIGYVKTHHAGYLPDSVLAVVAALEIGERTPLFLATTKWSRYSWYLRLPGERAHGWSGIVRCEASADREIGDVVVLADQVSVTLGRFASAPHKEARAPQNLFPIAGLERELRRRLGDPVLIQRALREAASRSR